MPGIVLDTDVASRLHSGALSGPPEWRLSTLEWLVTFVTVGEPTRGWTCSPAEHGENGTPPGPVLARRHPEPDA
ncbi:MAG TPA: hypothetical protein VGP02_10740 [Mycobacteriales bacterium]|jgi:hypothetical protein|nr:hypothetical protein [Mycobacteriales bacterium]